MNIEQRSPKVTKSTKCERRWRGREKSRRALRGQGNLEKAGRRWENSSPSAKPQFNEEAVNRTGKSTFSGRRPNDFPEDGGVGERGERVGVSEVRVNNWRFYGSADAPGGTLRPRNFLSLVSRLSLLSLLLCPVLHHHELHSRGPKAQQARA